MGFVPSKGGKDVAGILKAAARGEMKLVWLLGADEINTSNLAKSFVIYQGHHGDAGAAAADVILPGAAYTEKDSLYVNFEGRVQMARRATFPPGEAKEDWAIIRALSEHVGKTLPFDTSAALRDALTAAVPSFAAVDEILPSKWGKFGRSGKLLDEAVSAGLNQFHMSCAISRSSETMAACHQSIQSDTPSLAAE
jgi:NADH-quinone oxidoreductase subunit G